MPFYRTRPNIVRPSSLPISTTPAEMAELSSANSPAKQPLHRYRRFHGWDYSKGASFFITIATEPRCSLFGRVEQSAMVLSPLGEKVMEALEAIPRLNPGITLYGHVVMPDHVHLCCHLAPSLAEPLQVAMQSGGSRTTLQNWPNAVWPSPLEPLAPRATTPYAVWPSPLVPPLVEMADLRSAYSGSRATTIFSASRARPSMRWSTTSPTTRSNGGSCIAIRASCKCANH